MPKNGETLISSIEKKSCFSLEFQQCINQSECAYLLKQKENILLGKFGKFQCTGEKQHGSLKSVVCSYQITLLFSAAASGWAGWALAHPEFGSSVNPITTRGGQIMPTTLLLAHPDLKTQRQLCSCNSPGFLGGLMKL